MKNVSSVTLRLALSDFHQNSIFIELLITLVSVIDSSLLAALALEINPMKMSLCSADGSTTFSRTPENPAGRDPHFPFYPASSSNESRTVT